MTNIKRLEKTVRAFCGSFSPLSFSCVPDGDSFRWVVVEGVKAGPVIRLCGCGPDLAAPQALLQSAPREDRCISGVMPGLATLYRHVQLPHLGTQELRCALFDTLEQELGVSIEENIVAFEQFPCEGGLVDITAYVTKKDAVKGLLGQLSAQGVVPEWVLPKAAALAAFGRQYLPEEWLVVVDSDSEEVTVVLLYRGVVVENRSFPGSSTAFAFLKEPSGDSDEALKAILPWLTETGLAFKDRYGLVEDVHVLVTGPVIDHPLAVEVIAECLGLPLAPTDLPLPTYLYATPLGCALCALCGRADGSPNFREGELAFPRPLIRWRRPLVTLVVGCCALSASIAGYGYLRSLQIQSALQGEWLRLCLASHATAEEPNPATKGVQEYVLAGERLLSRVEQRALFPLQPDIPKVREVMTWLSSLMDSSDPLEKMELQSLQYALVKRPSKNHPTAHYQVRVDFEFSTTSVAHARHLHDLLLAPNPYVDGSSEVKWTQGNGKYRASFLLKDKTPYPQG